MRMVDTDGHAEQSGLRAWGLSEALSHPSAEERPFHEGVGKSQLETVLFMIGYDLRNQAR